MGNKANEMEIALSELTKEELIQLIKTKMFFSVTVRDIWWVRYESLSAQAAEKREQSMAMGYSLAMLKESKKLWDEAERIQKRADAVYQRVMGGYKSSAPAKGG